MKSRQKYSLLIILFLILSSLSLAQTSTPQITGVSVQGDGTILVNWTIGSDNGVSYYGIYRSTGSDGNFIDIGSVPKGTSSFVDKNDLFKTTSTYFCYKVIAFNADKTILSQSTPVVVSYNSTSSAAKRTWGSIKAMFR